jgi:hypothetical protein
VVTLNPTETCPQGQHARRYRNGAIVFHAYRKHGITPEWLRSLGGPVYPQIADAIESLDPEGLALSASIAEGAAA